ncbi:serine/threonine-protein phosphatase [Georgenia sp. 311]|uniref:Serine/threonine-protein phosphatase n=1 Tax=Georgenia wutianyii TaxID=2585135 RepID=A0ABX5VI67_9MICO|nr:MULTISPECIES: PP2C family serine/threonine-protein phosphatase [Georgenia]QDB77982.1 serine/threonine-protein phosphatase [Georgenia wutianyii]TNC18180.1 serine/threonine-protein phosphatase [Georgenia sp. 311]
MPLTVNFAARSDVGLVRSSNQDSGYAGPHLLVLADGMGGPAGGDIASSVALAHLVHLDEEQPAADDLLPSLRESVAAAHADLEERAEADPELAGLGTTCIAVLRSENKIAMVHIGDSRAYLLRDGELTRITTDHTFVQHLVDIGRLTPEQAERHPQRSVLLRVLGDTDGDVILDESVREAKVGDRWLLCSDGLSGVVSAETIAETLTRVADPGRCAEELIDLALRGGGPDNVTCVIADFLDADDLPDGLVPATTPQVVGAAATDRLRATRGTPGAAGRAAALTAPAPRPAEEDEEDQPRPRRRWIGATLLTLLVLAGLGAAAWFGYRWTQDQYYLAPDGEVVAIYRGIPQELGPLTLSEVHERTDLRLDDLPSYVQDRLEATMTVDSLEDAETRVRELRADVRRPADGATPAPTPTSVPGATQDGA